mgnify:CR=1
MKYFSLFLVGLWVHMVYSPSLPYEAVLAIKLYLGMMGWYCFMTFMTERK